MEKPDEIARLRRVIEAQEKALAHWRSEADRDAGTIKRYTHALEMIDRGVERDRISAAEAAWIAKEALK